MAIVVKKLDSPVPRKQVSHKSPGKIRGVSVLHEKPLALVFTNDLSRRGSGIFVKLSIACSKKWIPSDWNLRRQAVRGRAIHRRIIPIVVVTPVK